MAIRDGVNGPEFQDHREVDLEGYTIPEAVERLREAAKGLKDAKVTTDYYYDYGDTERRFVMHVSGWRKATKEEIAEHEEKLRKVQEQQDKHAAAMEQQLRKLKPEIFR